MNDREGVVSSWTPEVLGYQRVHSSCLSLPKGRKRGSQWEPCEPAPVADDWLKPEPQIASLVV